VTNAIGDLYLLYRCPNCDDIHDECILPLDEDGVALGVALGTVWVYERALGATDCRLLVATAVRDRPYGVAIQLDGDTLTAAIECLDSLRGRAVSPQRAYAVAARGAALPPAPATDEGIIDLVMGALHRAADDRAIVERLLRGVSLE
jgi:hypothetical protein